MNKLFNHRFQVVISTADDNWHLQNLSARTKNEAIETATDYLMDHAGTKARIYNLLRYPDWPGLEITLEVL